MIMSPGDIKAASLSTLAPVIAAGSISQAQAGFSSLATNSSNEAAPVAPSATRAATLAGLIS